MEKKAHRLEETEVELHSEKMSMILPSVIVLSQFRRVSAANASRPPALSRMAIMRRDEQRCQYCGDEATTVDHIIPRSKGGQFTWLNLVASCMPCNRKKSDLLLKQSGMKLKAPPREPRRAEGLRWKLSTPRTGTDALWAESWMKYL